MMVTANTTSSTTPSKDQDWADISDDEEEEQPPTVQVDIDLNSLSINDKDKDKAMPTGKPKLTCKD
jgi:hypothetical protein